MILSSILALIFIFLFTFTFLIFEVLQFDRDLQVILPNNSLPLLLTSTSLLHLLFLLNRMLAFPFPQQLQILLITETILPLMRMRNNRIQTVIRQYLCDSSCIAFLPCSSCATV